MAPTPTSPKLFALLVAIDAYQAPITPLHGCINDVRKLEAFLQGQKDHFELKVKTLTNDLAVKANIVDAFWSHLALAQKDDTVLFYYSGHGTQEEADPVFWPGETDKKLESLVCYDGLVMVNGSPKMNLLADKELRFLIHELEATKAHVITIFDCCHSGTNTRNGSFTNEGNAILERKVVNRQRLSMAFPQRSWSDFIFSDTLPYDLIKEEGIPALLKEGKHLQMAACQNDESAYEVAGEGVFTKNLIDILQRCRGNISYHRLQSTIQNYLRHQFKQTPKIYVSGDENLLFSSFLNKGTTESEIFGTVSFHQDLGWTLDMGAMQGIGPNKEIPLEEQSSGTTYNAQIKSVEVGYAQVSIQTDSEKPLDTSLIFKANTGQAGGRNLQIFISPRLIQNQKFSPLVDNIGLLSTLHMVQNASEADYCLVDDNDFLLLTHPERMEVPLVPKIPMETIAGHGADMTSNILEHLSKFEFVKHLTNPGAFMLRPDHMSIQVFDGERVVPIKNEELMLEYHRTELEWGGSIRVKIKNVSNVKLYCAVCYLSFNFGVFTRVLPAGVEGLEPGAEAWALDGAPINFKLEPEIVAYTYQESTSYLKVLVSTEDFTLQLQSLALDDLPGPLQSENGTRGLALSKEPEVLNDWTSRLITLRMPNPEL